MHAVHGVVLLKGRRAALTIQRQQRFALTHHSDLHTLTVTGAQSTGYPSVGAVSYQSLPSLPLSFIHS